MCSIPCSHHLTTCSACIHRSPQALLSTMGNFASDAEILKQCCWAILTLAVDDEIARRLAEEGACEAVVAAMRACPTERMVLTKACAAIVNLSGGNQTIKAKFGTIGACDEVIRAMRAFPRDGPLQKQVRLSLCVCVSISRVCPCVWMCACVQECIGRCLHQLVHPRVMENMLVRTHRPMPRRSLRHNHDDPE